MYSPSHHSSLCPLMVQAPFMLKWKTPAVRKKSKFEYNDHFCDIRTWLSEARLAATLVSRMVFHAGNEFFPVLIKRDYWVFFF